MLYGSLAYWQQHGRCPTAAGGRETVGLGQVKRGQGEFKGILRLQLPRLGNRGS